MFLVNSLDIGDEVSIDYMQRPRDVLFSFERVAMNRPTIIFDWAVISESRHLIRSSPVPKRNGFPWTFHVRVFWARRLFLMRLARPELRCNKYG